MKPPFAAVLTAMCLVSPNVDARGGGGGQSGGHSGGGHATSAGHHTGSSRSASTAAKHRSGTALGVQRDKRGKIARSEHAKDEFKKSHPCPSTGKSSGALPGYVVDHVTALKRGGADSPSNMQWQTKEAAKQKDKTE